MNETRPIVLHTGAIKLLSVSQRRGAVAASLKTAFGIRVALPPGQDCFKVKVAVKQDTVSDDGITLFHIETCTHFYCEPLDATTDQAVCIIYDAVQRALHAHHGFAAGLNAERNAPNGKPLDLPDLPMSEYVVFDEF